MVDMMENLIFEILKMAGFYRCVVFVLSVVGEG